jgi:diamine N-acetyltransferase
MAWIVRHGLPEDIPNLLTLFKGLAVAQRYEENVVKVREEDLLRDGFGDTKYFYFVVAEWRKGDHETDHERPEMAGYGFFFFNYSSADGRVIYLEDLYVKEKYQSEHWLQLV